MSLPELKADSWTTVTGRGQVAAVSKLPDGVTEIRQHDFVLIDGQPYRVTGIEVATTLMVSPRVTRWGFVVRILTAAERLQLAFWEGLERCAKDESVSAACFPYFDPDMDKVDGMLPDELWRHMQDALNDLLARDLERLESRFKSKADNP